MACYGITYHFIFKRQKSENVGHKPKTFWNVFSKVPTARIMGRFARKKESVFAKLVETANPALFPCVQLVRPW